MDEKLHAAALLLLNGLDLKQEPGILPTKLGSHLCLDVFDFYSWLRQENIMTRGVGVKGSTPHTPSGVALKNEWMFILEKTGIRDKSQPYFTEVGCNEVARRMLLRQPSGIQKMLRVASVFMLSDFKRPEVVVTEKSAVKNMLPVGSLVKYMSMGTLQIMEVDAEEGYHLHGNGYDLWVDVGDLSEADLD